MVRVRRRLHLYPLLQIPACFMVFLGNLVNISILVNGRHHTLKTKRRVFGVEGRFLVSHVDQEEFPRGFHGGAFETIGCLAGPDEPLTEAPDAEVPYPAQGFAPGLLFF